MTKNTSHTTHTWATTGGRERKNRSKWQQGVLEILQSQCAASTQETEPKPQYQHLPGFRNLFASMETTLLWHHLAEFSLCAAVLPGSYLKLIANCPNDDPRNSWKTFHLESLEIQVLCGRIQHYMAQDHHRSERSFCPSVSYQICLPLD